MTLSTGRLATAEVGRELPGRFRGTGLRKQTFTPISPLSWADSKLPSECSANDDRTRMPPMAPPFFATPDIRRSGAVSHWRASFAFAPNQHQRTRPAVKWKWLRHPLLRQMEGSTVGRFRRSQVTDQRG